MSIYYDIKEHLKITARSDVSAKMTEITRNRLALLAAQVSLGEAALYRLSIVTETGTIETESCASPEYQSILDCLMDAANVELLAEYSYSGAGECVSFKMARYLDGNADELPEGVYYAMYYHTDSNSDGSAGTILAYGKDKHGLLRRGVVEPAPVEVMPDDGNWFAPETTVVYEPESVAGKDLAAIEAVCRELCAFGENNELSVADSEVSFFLNDVKLRSREAIEEYVRLCGELIRLTDNECGAGGGFVDTDTSSGELRILNISFDETGNAELSMTTA